MSTSRTTTVVWAAAVVFVATLGTIVLLAFAIEDGARLLSVIGLVLPAAGTLALAMLAVLKIAGVDDKVDKVARQTTDLTNGLLDAKVRAAVADVLAPHMIDPGAEQQLQADRRRVDNANTDVHQPPSIT